MLNLFKGRLQILPTNARAGSLPLRAEESGELSAQEFDATRSAAIRACRRRRFDVLAQIFAERTFPVSSFARARYQAGERATGSGPARQKVQ
jgi:hypothetical protein